LRVYGSKKTVAGYYYVQINEKRIFLPKTCSIYNQKEEELPVVNEGYISKGKVLPNPTDACMSIQEVIEWERKNKI